MRIGPALRGLEHHNPERNMHLGGGQTGPIGIDHGFHHVIDQMADFRGPGVGNGPGRGGQDRVAHAGDFENCHGRKYGPVGRSGQDRETVNFRWWKGKRPSGITPAS